MMSVSIRDADFLLFEHVRLAQRHKPVKVSIRDADFLLFERIRHKRFHNRKDKFQSAMRIFCCSNKRRSDLHKP